MSDYRELTAHFKQYRSRVTANTEASMKNVAAKMTKAMRETAPKDTGNLGRKIRYSTSHEGGHIIIRIHCYARGKNGAKYAEFVEFGTGIYNEHGDGRATPWIVTAVVHGQLRTWKTHGMRPQPFIRPAFRKYAPELQKMIRESMRVDGMRL